MDRIQETVRNTLLYSMCFSYPLSVREVYIWQIGTSYSEDQIQRSMDADPIMACRNGLYYVKGYSHTVSNRILRAQSFFRKLKIARRASYLLAWIPTVQAVFLTGNLAMKNSSEDDDIDVLIVTSAGWMWITRLLSTLLLDLFRMRRKPGDQHVRDKICLNMVMDSSCLEIPKNEQDIYSAHEALQMIPLMDRSGITFRFASENRWIETWLPVAGIFRAVTKPRPAVNKVRECFLERAVRFLQIHVMLRRRTTEVITSRMIRFHPRDFRKILVFRMIRLGRKFGS